MPDWIKVAGEVAKGEGIDPALFMAQIQQESGGDPSARSPAGAIGVAQIVPKYHPDVDPTDPIASLRYAAKWMRQLIDQYGGDVRKALAHYNGGGGAVQALVSGKPYGETMQYLGAILGPSTAEASESDQQGGAQVAGSYGNPEIDRIIAAKGEPTSITPIDPYVNVETTDKAGKKTRTQESNPTPKYRFFWAGDGSHLDVQTSDDGSRAIVAGDAGAKTEAPAPKRVPAPSTDQYITQEMPDGTIRQIPNKNYVPRQGTVRQPKAPDRITAGGKVYQKNDDTGQWEVIVDGSKGEKGQGTSTHVIGGRIYTTDAQGGVIKITDARTAEDIEATNLGLTKDRLAIQKASEGLLPAQQVIIQKQLETIAYVKGLIAKGQLEPEAGDKYLNASRAAAEAALRGTTPYEEQKDLQQVQRQAATDASGLLRERMQSMTSLGSSLASSALSGASHAMLRPGQTSLGVDPLAMAKQFSADAGGDKLLEVANALLARAGLPAGGAPGAGVPSAPMSAGLMAGGLTPPVSPESSLSMPGALPAGLR